jgi:hypothetical protein
MILIEAVIDWFCGASEPGTIDFNLTPNYDGAKLKNYPYYLPIKPV